MLILPVNRWYSEAIGPARALAGSGVLWNILLSLLSLGFPRPAPSRKKNKKEKKKKKKKKEAVEKKKRQKKGQPAAAAPPRATLKSPPGASAWLSLLRPLARLRGARVGVCALSLCCFFIFLTPCQGHGTA